jgi:hypothetical protein
MIRLVGWWPAIPSNDITQQARRWSKGHRPIRLLRPCFCLLHILFVRPVPMAACCLLSLPGRTLFERACLVSSPAFYAVDPLPIQSWRFPGGARKCLRGQWLWITRSGLRWLARAMHYRDDVGTCGQVFNPHKPTAWTLRASYEHCGRWGHPARGRCSAGTEGETGAPSVLPPPCAALTRRGVFRLSV